MAMPVATILYSFSGIVEVVVGGWVMEDFPRSVELVARGQQRGSRHCRRGVLRGFLVWIEIHTTAWCGTCFTNCGEPALGGIAGGERSASAGRAVRELGPWYRQESRAAWENGGRRRTPGGAPASPPTSRKNSPLHFLLSPFSAAGRGRKGRARGDEPSGLSDRCASILSPGLPRQRLPGVCWPETDATSRAW
jgi:hypothetical protein